MKIIHLVPIALASFYANANDSVNSELASVSTDAYEVTITVNHDENNGTSTNQTLKPNSSVSFDLQEEHSYVQGVSVTHKWYHNLFGIEPEPEREYGSFKTGLEGTVSLTELSHNKVKVKMKNSFTEQTGIEKIGEIEMPKLTTKSSAWSGNVQMGKNATCIQPEPDVSFCVEKVSKR